MDRALRSTRDGGFSDALSRGNHPTRPLNTERLSCPENIKTSPQPPSPKKPRPSSPVKATASKPTGKPKRQAVRPHTHAPLVPGEILLAKDDIVAFAGRPTIVLTVANHGDRPIQVGSHCHFFETNRALRFPREQAFGFRLKIPSGTAVRFEPGRRKTCLACRLRGKPHGLWYQWIDQWLARRSSC